MARALGLINLLRSVIGEERQHLRIQRQDAIIGYLERLRADQVATTGYLFKTAQNSLPSLFRSISLAKFEEELFQLKLERRIANTHGGHWKVLP